jgi:hypothetical protein
VHDTRDLFEAAWLKAGPVGLGIMEKNRFASDQLRLRRNCYGVADSTMPNLSTAPGIAGAIVFKKTVLQHFKQTKDATLTLTLPLVGKHRKARRNLDTAAIDADALFAQETDRMSQTFLEANPENLFVAYRFKQPLHVNAGAPKAKGKKRKATSGDDSGADGVAVASGTGPKPGDKFESKGTVWQLFRIYETGTEAGCNSIACAYFDVDAAESFGQEYEYF